MSKTLSFISMGPVNLDRESKVPLYRQIYQAVRDSILNNQLEPGTRLPSTRILCGELNVGRNTIVSAFNQLIDEGYLESTVGSGTRVALSLPDQILQVRGTAFEKQKDLEQKTEKTGINLSFRGEQMLSVPFLEQTRKRAFSPAVPTVDMHFIKIWEKLMIRKWRLLSENQFGYGSALGYGPLRKSISEYLGAYRGVRCKPEQVIITSGAQQALHIAATLLLDREDETWIEEPSYDGAKAALRSAAAKVITVPVDREGMVVQDGKKKAPSARLAYISPSNQYPLGVTMSLSRRLELIHWAAENNAWILEDDYDSEFRYTGKPITALQGIDQEGRVIYIGTFSKVLFPSLRLGYIVAPPDLVEPFHAIRAHVDRGSPLFEQVVLNEFIAEGHFARHIHRMRTLYGKKREALIQGIRNHLPDILEVHPSEGGLHLVGWLPPGIDDRQISQAVKTIGYEAPALSRYYIGKPDRGGLLFGFTTLDASEMDSAFARVAPVIRKTVSLFDI